MKTRFFSKVLAALLSSALCSVPAIAGNQLQPSKQTLTIIGYHEITNHNNALIPDYAVTTQQFQQHLDWLKQHGYHFIGVDQLLKAHQGQAQLPSKPVLLTVDDGYASFYQNVYPIIKAQKIPVVLAVVGSWLAPAQDQKVDFAGEMIARDDLLSWQQLQEMQRSGLVEIASHSYNLHRGIVGNPQGNSEPAAVTRQYDPQSNSYENDADYQQRIQTDLKRNNQLLVEHGIRSPRVMVWPYGRYNMYTVNIAKQLGMPIALSLDDGANHLDRPLGQLNRILIEGGMTTEDLAQEIDNRQQNLGDRNRPQKIMHIDLDYIYDPDPV